MTRPIRRKDDYVLAQVHDLAQKNFTREQNADAWKNHLSTEDYVKREYVLGLSKMATSENHELMVFIMTANDHPEIPLCSCELLVRKGLRYKKTELGSVEKEDILSGCIGAVFTYKEHRGQGLALIMIDHLVEMAKQPSILGPNGFIFLYSEVGEYYARNGFKSFGIPITKVPLLQSEEAYSPSSTVELVQFHDFKDLFNVYSTQFDQDVREKVAADGLERVSVSCNEGYVDWFHLRAKYLGVKLFEKTAHEWDFANESLESLSVKFAKTDPNVFGLKLKSASGTLKGFIVWTYDYEYSADENQFHNYVTLINKVVVHGYDKDETTLELIQEMKNFLEAKHSEPQMSNLEELKIWESEMSPEVLKTLIKDFGAKSGYENGSRSAIMMNSKDDDEKLKAGRIIWEENTKLPWF